MQKNSYNDGVTMDSRFKVRSGVHLIFRKDGKILLLKRRSTGYDDGKFGLVAGHLDEGETLTQTAIREVNEEIGVLIKSQDLQPIHFLNSIDSEKNEYVLVFFAIDKWINEPKNMEPEKCSEMIWAEESKLPENISPLVKHVINKIKHRELYSEFGW